MDKDPILAVAIHAARRAAAVLVDVSRDLKRRPSHAKDHADIVSNADTEAENAMIATLRAAFPEHAIVGKEAGEIVSQIAGGNRAGKNSLKWIVDPLDGTVNFRHGYPYFAVSIALTHGNEVTHAVVLDPVHDELFTAIRGKGAQLNGTPIRTSTCVRLEEALVGTVIPAHGSARLAAYLPVLNALVPKCAGIRRAGTCALDLAYVAVGAARRLLGDGPQSVERRGRRAARRRGRRARRRFRGRARVPAHEGRDRVGAGRLQSAARCDRGGGAAGALSLGAPVDGSSEIAQSVIAAIAAIDHSSTPKPAALTTGPSSQTAAELTPNETKRRMPLTRERIRSSTKRTIIASVNGIAPNTATMNATCSASSVQPVAPAAAMKSGTWSATTHEVEPLHRIAVDEQADRDLRERCDDVDAREERARAARDRRRCPRAARARAGRCRWS